MKNIFTIITSGFLVAGSLSVITSTLIADDLPTQGLIPFSLYDANKDGFINTKEFYDVREKRTEQKIDAGMPMQNAKNSPDFSFFDVNGDGKLTEVELTSGQKMQMKNNNGNMGMKGKGMGQRGYNMPTFESFDTNKDGVISDDEMEEGREKRIEERTAQGNMMRNIDDKSEFESIDTNHDKKVSKEEFLNYQTKQRQK